MGKPKLDIIKEKIMNGKDFELTRAQYYSLTGADIPQNKNYTEKRSAVAKLAREFEYEVIIIPERIQFKKIKE